MSKKISDMPSKASLVSNDVLTILDSADSFVNKKAAISALGLSSKVNVQGYSTPTTTTPSYDLSGNEWLNRFYKFQNALTSLTFTGNDVVLSRYESEFRFTTASSFTFSAPALAGNWAGGTPTFEPNKSYVIAIKNGTAAWGEVS